MASLAEWYRGKKVVITGASSGIGKDLALLLGEFGADLALVARRRESMEEVRQALQGKGGEVLVLPADVSDRQAMEGVAREVLDRFGHADIVIGNAGVGGLNPAPSFDLDIHQRTYAINCLGLAYTLVPFIPSMIARRDGILVGVSSLAGFRGLPKAGSYSSSKAAQGVFLESLRVDLRPYGISVLRIHPGFVETPMTDHDEFRMPFKVPVRKSSWLIAKAIRRRKAVYLYPWPMKVLTWVNRMLPPFLYDRVVPALSGQKEEIRPRML
ncbi:MAG TPA: SDR family NAD(P)-dependent oxidoreductase [Myxococcota bacterium]|nr:SDR family NAD(P)-dependent oxidoreductase [Myxococcota bacterium]HQK51288.1 SDR family NAD(P)-dependent oxidoreductase [Myxococcota bacterium]